MSSPSTSTSSDLVVLSTLRFWPFAPDSASTAEIFWRGRTFFKKWASANIHHFPVSSNPLPKPSPASILVFAVLFYHRHDSSPLVPTVTVDRSLPCALLTLSMAPESVRLLGEIVKPDSDLRRILWHIFHPVSALSPTSSSSSWAKDTCGFVGCAGLCRPVPPGEARQAFRLQNLFRQVTRELADSDSTEPLSQNSTPPLLSKVGSPRKRTRGAGWLNLPEEVLHIVVLYLHPKDCTALSNVNEEFRNFMEPVVPGLTLRLYPHQVDAVSRMISMEWSRPARRSMPLLHRFDIPSMSNVCVAADVVDGSILRLARMPELQAPRGGLFCDEPGLGKTITALSLVLKTLGQNPRPPEGRMMETLLCEDGEGVVNVYREPPVGRYCSYGDTSAIPMRSRRAKLFPFSEIDKRRSSSRQVKRPDFHNPSVGLGSVPRTFGHENDVVYLSRGSLIVVPPVLTQHWEDQISLHVREGTLRVLYVKRVRDLPDSAEKLATDFDLVLTSFNVIAELSSSMREKAPLLMRVRFLRVIVDEGHKLSGGSLSSFVHACERLRAERRWVMTGTPTPSTVRCDVDHLYHLLRFIRDEEYGMDKKTWIAGVREPFAEYCQESLERLRPVLGDLMIRADKSILKSRCHISNTILDFTEESAIDYNWLVSLTRRNLLTADWFSEKNKESLLNKNNMKEAQMVVRNLRYACNLGGTQDALFTESEVIEMLDILYTRYREKARIHLNDRFDDPVANWPLLIEQGISEEKKIEAQKKLQETAALWGEVQENNTQFLRLSKALKKPENGKRFVTRIYSGVLNDIGRSFLEREAHCARCHVFTSIPMITPCGHLLCDECTILDKEKCTALHCGSKYNLDNKENVPEDLIELQPAAYSRDNWKHDWDTKKSAKMSYLVDKLRNLPVEEKWFPGESEPRQLKPKVIIHSTITDHLQFVALTLKDIDDLKDSYIEMFKNSREFDVHLKKIKGAAEFARQSVRIFATDPKRNILLLSTKHGSVGLDLSFAQYIFLLEPVWDASMELQIISRAHRIGSKQDIYVERLVMKGSVEHEILEELENGKKARGPSFGGVRGQEDLSRVRSILWNMKPVVVTKEKTNGSILPQKRQSCGDEVEVVEPNSDRRVRFRIAKNV